MKLLDNIRRRLRPGSNIAGGSAPASGIDFQAAVTAIAAIAVARGIPIRWLEGVVDDTPVSISAETCGPGDDLRLDLSNTDIVEVQAKRGLAAGDRLWSALIELAGGITSKSISHGVLVVSPDSSKSIRKDLARDIVRMG